MCGKDSTFRASNRAGTQRLYIPLEGGRSRTFFSRGQALPKSAQAVIELTANHITFTAAELFMDHVERGNEYVFARRCREHDQTWFGIVLVQTYAAGRPAMFLRRFGAFYPNLLG